MVMVAGLTMVMLFLLLFLGMPIAIVLGFSGSIGLLLVNGWDGLLGVLQTSPHSSAASFILTTIPMFILMAEFMTATRITSDMFNAGQKWMGHLPGGLGIATVFAGAGLAAVSGSSTASAGTLATSAVPEMRKFGYSVPFSMGTVSIAGTLAIMIPPSIILIMYGILTEVPIGQLLIAGIIPGILTALGYIVTILIWVKVKPEIAPKIPPVQMKEKLHSLKNIWPMLLLITIVIGSIYSGIVTATEAGAIGAFSALVIALAMRRMTLKAFKHSLERTVKSTIMIMTIIIGAMILSQFITTTQITQSSIQFIQEYSISKWVVLFAIVGMYLILGMFLDQLAILILTLAFTFPIIVGLGFNPIWFGIIVTKTVEIGLVTPPVGMNVFVASGATGIKTTEAFKGVFWFVITDLIILFILILLPFLSTWLPGLMN